MAIKIGHFILSHPHEGKIAIRNVQTGEAGIFNLEEFVAVVDKFFADKF